jgi:hypothetical protein
MMDFRPLVALTINGIPLGLGLFSLLSSVRITDQLGVVSDTLDLSFSSSGLIGLLAMPEPGAEIEVALGSIGKFRNMGVFVADEVEEASPPHTISVTGRAKINGATDGGLGPVSQQKSRSWAAGLTLSAIVATMASESGLQAAVTASVAGLVPGHLDQLDESDLNLLTRLARRHDLVAKPAGRTLFVGLRGESLTASGGSLPPVVLTSGMLSSWRMTRRLGETVGTVTAAYRDLESAVDVDVSVGEGEPVRRLRGRFRDEAEARAAADAESRRASRAKEALELELPGDARLVSGSPLFVPGLSAASSGEWWVTEVAHSLSSAGFTSSVTAERPQ